MLKVVFIFLVFLNFRASAAEMESLSVGKGTAKFNGLLQVWAINDTTVNQEPHSNYRVRRAELKFSGSVHSKTRWFVMLDPAKSLKTGAISTDNDNKILQDLGVGFTLCEGLELIAGQFKIPTTSEGLMSSSELLLPERSYLARAFGDRREPEVMLDYNVKPLRVRLMSSNGQSTPGAATANISDTNDSKDTNGRIDFEMNDLITIGIFSSQSYSLLGLSTRTGGNIQFTLERTVFNIETVQANELNKEKTSLVSDVSYLFSEELQAVVRYEDFSQISKPELFSSAATLGVNYFVSAHNSKIQLLYSMLKNMSGDEGTYKPLLRTTEDSLVILNFQAAL